MSALFGYDTQKCSLCVKKMIQHGMSECLRRPQIGVGLIVLNSTCVKPITCDLPEAQGVIRDMLYATYYGLLLLEWQDCGR